jgi:hypothetical protein
MTKCRLWRVDITHIAGYQAPSLLIETTEVLKYKAEEEAIQIAKTKSRLNDFPESWSFTSYCTGKKLRNGKWLTDAEIEARKLKLRERA